METTLCAADACNGVAQRGDFCPQHTFATLLAWRDISKEGEKARRKKENKLGTLDYLVECERTVDNVAALFRNISKYNDAFDECLGHFRECQERGTKLTQRLNMDNARGVEKSVRIVKVSSSDFSCDFINAAKRSLGPRLLGMFDLVFVQRKYSRMPGSDYYRMRQQIGRWLVRNRIWPLHQYFKPVYL